MQWDRFFEDLEDQLDSEWEAERAALDTEAERLRLARLSLRERLVSHLGDRAESVPSIGLVDGTALAGRVTAVGADWLALAGATRRGDGAVVPLASIATIGMAQTDLLRSARGDAAHPRPRLAERMTLGFVLRDLVRKRAQVTVSVAGGLELCGTIDRAGEDHLDLALHEWGTPRRGELVSGYRIVPYAAVLRLRIQAPVRLG
ncbi:hypothetical protein [Microbacterium invictum]|uniref:Uncharacterized protein n=1 Tax=Microbacterium invictum TaxID=515415 RepID=A0AA40VMW5_9MICO|nr:MULTISPECIES: hypothetical protein [Microbacterium]MBB4139713.1 hypothetical protein [Microbacterium invictum]